ncbi:MAG TPA: cobyric acid synthase [Ilumatobacter sp.]|nr:cobyric acid synthase [Ilumatobacter sp.]
MNLMVLGCTSNAGKSLLVTGLCRWFARQGVKVAPFKAQNMSNNARVVDGGEIGVAQWLQARAAGVEPTVHMNPVLLKPEADTRSQVVVHGVARPDLTDVPWMDRGRHLWPPMVESFDEVANAYDLVIIEGAGSPAEINLPDLVNNKMLEYADARALLAVDIDRGGAFAHLYGTWALVPDTTRERLAGYVLNKFRGDASLLSPAPELITERTGMPNIGVLPMLHHELPDEEGATIRARPVVDSSASPLLNVVIVRYPFGSNLDEWHLLPHAAHVRWATRGAELRDADLIVLPGSKHVAADAAWMRERGFAEALAAAAAAGTRIVGVCGGAMMLGERIEDPHGVEGATVGFALLPLRTEMAATKTTEATTVSFPAMSAPWAALAGATVQGYEIRHGQVHGPECGITTTVWAVDNVMATTVHGLFEDSNFVQAVCGIRPAAVLHETFDVLADAIDEHLDTALLHRLSR